MIEKGVNYKKLCVRQHKDEYLFPKTIPKQRGPLATQICCFICVALFMSNILFWDNNSFKTILMQYSIGILLSIAFQFIYRCILMCEEINHLISRYNGNVLILLKNTFYFRPFILIILSPCTIYCVYHWCTVGTSIGNVDLSTLICCLNIYLLGKIMDLNGGPLNDALWVAENNGLDYGSGMAYSFFHGYLNLVLPKTGTEDKNLKEIMQDYEDRNGIKFSIYKLFILIPKSLRCFVSLLNEYSPSIEESSSLEPKIITVAGVQNRVYKNAVYKIISEKFGRKKNYIYVSAEYATPLKTFKDVFDTRGEHSEYYNKYKKDIILQFYLTLRKVLEDKGLSQFCELIYYEDTFQKDGVTCYHDVGEIIRERLKELKKKKD